MASKKKTAKEKTASKKKAASKKPLPARKAAQRSVSTKAVPKKKNAPKKVVKKRGAPGKMAAAIPAKAPRFAGPHLTSMRGDSYFAPELVDAIESELTKLVVFLDECERTADEIQAQCDTLTEALNVYEDDLETGAREDIAATILEIFGTYGVTLDLEEALRNRAW